MIMLMAMMIKMMMVNTQIKVVMVLLWVLIKHY